MKNEIIITSLPYQVTVNTIREKIADAKEQGGLPELVSMDDHSGFNVDLRLTIRNNSNPYKFMKKLISEIPGLEKSYPVYQLIKRYGWKNIYEGNKFGVFVPHSMPEREYIQPADDLGSNGETVTK